MRGVDERCERLASWMEPLIRGLILARDYYGLLGVPKSASQDEIRRAYRKLARGLHPDVNPDPAAQQRFKDVTAVYDVLSDPAKRQIVDLGGDPLSSHQGERTAQSQQPPPRATTPDTAPTTTAHQQTSQQQGGFFRAGDLFGSGGLLGDSGLFDGLFGGRAQPTAASYAPPVAVPRDSQAHDSLGVSQAVQRVANQLLRDPATRSSLQQRLNYAIEPSTTSYNDSAFRQVVVAEPILNNADNQLLARAVHYEMVAQLIENGGVPAAATRNINTAGGAGGIQNSANESLHTFVDNHAYSLARDGDPAAQIRVRQTLRTARNESLEALQTVPQEVKDLLKHLPALSATDRPQPLDHVSMRLQALEIGVVLSDNDVRVITTLVSTMNDVTKRAAVIQKSLGELGYEYTDFQARGARIESEFMQDAAGRLASQGVDAQVGISNSAVESRQRHYKLRDTSQLRVAQLVDVLNEYGAGVRFPSGSQRGASAQVLDAAYSGATQRSRALVDQAAFQFDDPADARRTIIASLVAREAEQSPYAYGRPNDAALVQASKEQLATSPPSSLQIKGRQRVMTR